VYERCLFRSSANSIAFVFLCWGLQDVKKTRQLIKHPREKDHPASLDWAYPEYFLSCPLPEEVLYQPHVRVPMKTDGFPHKDVFQLVSRRTLKGLFKSNAERERAARIWAEFISPWYGYPSNWIAAELRESYKGDDSSCTVKCKLLFLGGVLPLIGAVSLMCFVLPE